jgi:hypothetical protein
VLQDYVTDAVNEAAQLKAEHIDTVPFSVASGKNNMEVIRRSARELADLAHRAEAIAEEGRIQELQEAASRIGRSLLLVSYNRSEEPGAFTDDLQSIGHELHLMETERLYMDGGQSMRRIVQRVHDLHARLQGLLQQYQLQG